MMEHATLQTMGREQTEVQSDEPSTLTNPNIIIGEDFRSEHTTFDDDAKDLIRQKTAATMDQVEWLSVLHLKNLIVENELKPITLPEGVSFEEYLRTAVISEYDNQSVEQAELVHFLDEQMQATADIVTENKSDAKRKRLDLLNLDIRRVASYNAETSLQMLTEPTELPDGTIIREIHSMIEGMINKAIPLATPEIKLGYDIREAAASRRLVAASEEFISLATDKTDAEILQQKDIIIRKLNNEVDELKARLKLLEAEKEDYLISRMEEEFDSTPARHLA